MRRRLIWIAPLAIVGMAVFVALGGFIVRELWNYVLPPLFGWRQIVFWQALALLVLCRILFGGLGWRGSSGRSDMRGRMAERMGQRMADRWQRMTPEEREQFRQGMRARGCDPFAGESKSAPSSPGEMK